jgi:hypothetical protein
MSASSSQVTEQVTERLAAHSLHGPVFDVAAITADLGSRIELDRSLDSLIGEGDPGPAAAPFDPRALR